MKNILYLFLFLILMGCQKMPIQKTNRNVSVSFQQTNIGSAANDGTGDPLRTFAQKQNSNWTLAESTFGNIYTSGEVDAIVDDTIPLNTALIGTSTKAIIQAQIDESLASFEGTGSSSTDRYVLSGRTGDTGFPVSGDSLIIHTSFIAHPSITFFREGQYQQQHADNTTSDGYWFNQATGTLTVKPIFGDNEQLIVLAEEPIVVHELVAEGGSGGGGSPPDTPLLDSLLAVWEMDEVSGTSVTDALGVNHGTTTATPNQPLAKLGKSKLYNGITRSSIPYNVSMIPDGDELSVSVWFYLTELPSVSGHAAGIVRLCDAQAPYYTANVYLQTTNTIGFQVTNSTGTVYEFESAAGAVAAGQWYQLIAVNEGAGENAKIYLNGVDVCTFHPTAFTGALLQFDSVVRIGNNSDAAEYGTVGYIDQVILYKQALTPADVASLYNAGAGKIYPFN